MDESQPSQTEKKRTIYARWITSTTLTFCDICIQAIQKGLRPGTHFTSKGWSIVVNSFNEVSGENYDKPQLKIKWDSLKTNWKLWKQLIGKETGLGWDPKKKTIDASADWWNEKLKVLPSAAKFRKEGLEPELVDRLDIMFYDTVATGEYARTPSSFVQIDENMQALSDELTVNMEGGGDSTEEDFEKSIDDTMQNSGKDVETSTESKRKRNLRNEKRDKGKNVRKRIGGAAKLREDIPRLVASVESRNNLMSTTPISTLLEDVSSLPGVHPGSELFYFASYAF